MTKAVYPGTFDPPTKGHIDVVRRGAMLFEQLIVAVGRNPGKKPSLSLAERVEMLRDQTRPFANVTVDTFEGLVVDYVHRVGFSAILRGIRTFGDFEHELQMAQMNRGVSGDVETIFLMSRPEYAFVSSGLIKQIARFGGDISAFVPDGVAERLREKLSST